MLVCTQRVSHYVFNYKITLMALMINCIYIGICSYYIRIVEQYCTLTLMSTHVSHSLLKRVNPKFLMLKAATFTCPFTGCT